ncbi:unnamed protein product [Boreogadus saida]
MNGLSVGDGWIAYENGQATGPTGGGAGTSPPHQKSAMEALLRETFAGKEVKDKKPFADAIEEEVAYKLIVIH